MKRFILCAAFLLVGASLQGTSFPKLVVHYLERVPQYTDLDTIRVSPLYPIDLMEDSKDEVVVGTLSPQRSHLWEESYLAAEEEVFTRSCCESTDNCCALDDEEELTGLAAAGFAGGGGSGGSDVFGFSAGGVGGAASGRGKDRDYNDSGDDDDGGSNGGNGHNGRVPVPEPSTYLLLTLLLSCVLVYQLRKRHERSR